MKISSHLNPRETKGMGLFSRGGHVALWIYISQHSPNHCQSMYVLLRINSYSRIVVVHHHQTLSCNRDLQLSEPWEVCVSGTCFLWSCLWVLVQLFPFLRKQRCPMLEDMSAVSCHGTVHWESSHLLLVWYWSDTELLHSLTFLQYFFSLSLEVSFVLLVSFFLRQVLVLCLPFSLQNVQLSFVLSTLHEAVIWPDFPHAL